MHACRLYSIISSVAQSCPALRPHGLQHARLPCPSLTPGVHPNPCPLSRWCHPTVSSSVIPFSSCLRSFPVWGSFPMSQLFTSGGQSTGVSASASVLPMNIQDCFPIGLTGWIITESTKAWFSLKGTSSNLLQQVCYPVGSSCQITKMHMCSENLLYYKSPGFTFLFIVWNFRNLDNSLPESLIILAVACIWVYSNLLADNPQTPLFILAIPFFLWERGVWLYI